MSPDIPKEFLARLRSITAKRARTVIDHILEHGSITTEELKEKYRYNHPPRAVRDVRERGIPIQTFKAIGSDGRTIAAYRFNLKAVVEANKGGRKAFPKITKDALLARGGPFCATCGLEFEPRYLQVDHRVPYEVAGENLSDELDQLMLLCGSCNRGKSWSCEHCENWQKGKDAAVCQACYWASPQDYQHIARVQVRRIDVAWKGSEVRIYDKLRDKSDKKGVRIQDLVKKILQDSLE